MLTIFRVIFVLFLSACINKTFFVPMDEAEYKNGKFVIPFEVLEDSRSETLAKYGIVYIGMPKDDLQKAGFTKEILVDYFKEGDKELLTFSDWYTKKPGDTITFVIENGKIKEWFKQNSKNRRDIWI